MPDPLVLKFDPQTVDHLGAKMYSHLPNAIAELVANAYDADATQVVIRISSDNSIAIEDDGHGMSRDDVADKYLRIGRNRRQALDSLVTESGKRAVSGKKGLGKLALFGIGRHVELRTTRTGNDYATVIHLDYDEMMESEGDYRPAETSEASESTEHGSIIRLSRLKRATSVDATDLAFSLSRLFNYIGSDFKVIVVSQEGREVEITPELRVQAVDVEFEWDFPTNWTGSDGLGPSEVVKGRIVSSRSPLRHGMRGITLFANGRLVNEPEFFGASESSFAFSYLTGYLELDFLDSIEPDVIATDRRAIDWDTPRTIELRRVLQGLMLRLAREWRARRAEVKKSKVETKIGGRVEAWVSSIRSEEQAPVRELVDVLESDDMDISVERQAEIIGLVKKVAPPHAEYVWRHLHPSIQSVTKNYYENGDFYTAVQEAIKYYINSVRLRSGVSIEGDANLLENVFAEPGGVIRVFKPYMDSHPFSPLSEQNVQRGQKAISVGILAGFRNLLAHEEIRQLQAHGAFTFDDCLDALSILSHLMRRLDNAVIAAL